MVITKLEKRYENEIEEIFGIIPVICPRVR
jgi:hypothetical protein